jgi:hypothetical protein
VLVVDMTPGAAHAEAFNAAEKLRAPCTCAPSHSVRSHAQTAAFEQSEQFNTASGSSMWWQAKRQVTMENRPSAYGSGGTSPGLGVEPRWGGLSSAPA